MTDLAVRDFTREDWSAAIAGFRDLSLMQCWEYAEAKARTGPWRVERGVFVDGRRTVGAFQALVRALPAGLPGGLVWINRGPLWRHEEAAPGRLAAMLGALCRRYAEERGMYLRLAPPVAEGALVPADVAAAGLKPAAAPGWASATLDLTPPLDALRANLKAKWRGHLKQGEGAGIEVRAGCEAGLFEAFLAHHRELIAERRFATSLTPELLRCLQDLLPAGRKMTVFLAYKDGALLGSVLIARYGDTCEYLAGNTGDEGRRRNAGQILLWRALAAMKEEGCRTLDLSGMDSQATPEGILRFKQGLGAVPYRLTAELEALGGGVLGRLVRWRVNRAREA